MLLSQPPFLWNLFFAPVNPFPSPSLAEPSLPPLLRSVPYTLGSFLQSLAKHPTPQACLRPRLAKLGLTLPRSAPIPGACTTSSALLSPLSLPGRLPSVSAFHPSVHINRFGQPLGLGRDPLPLPHLVSFTGGRSGNLATAGGSGAWGHRLPAPSSRSLIEEAGGSDLSSITSWVRQSGSWPNLSLSGT